MIENGKTKTIYQGPKSKQIIPWHHHTLIVLREDISGSLDDVWRKINATQNADRRVLLVLQDPKLENKKHTRTQGFFQDINGTVVAWFPTGTIPFGHACGWTDSHKSWKGNSHSWILKDGNQIRPPTDVDQDCMQRHADLMNTSPVRFILFPANNDNTQSNFDIDKRRLRKLAYLIGGIGYIQHQNSIAWMFNNQKVSLAWSHQGSDNQLDFTTPWRMCMWQPSRDR